MVDAKDAYRKDQLTKELREKLLKAFQKNAAKRATRVDLEKQLQKIVEELKANDGVTEIINDQRYSEVEVRNSRQWLKDIEEEVAAKVKKARRKSKVREASGEKKVRTRTDNDSKKQFLINFFANKSGEPVKLTEIQEALKASGFSGQATSWLKSLELADGVLKDVVPGNRRAGKKFYPRQVSFLKFSN